MGYDDDDSVPVGRVNYEAMLLAVSYIEAGFKKDEVSRQMILETTEPETLMEGLSNIAISLVMFESNGSGANPKMIIDALRTVALERSIEGNK